MNELLMLTSFRGGTFCLCHVALCLFFKGCRLPDSKTTWSKTLAHQSLKPVHFLIHHWATSSQALSHPLIVSRGKEIVGERACQ